MSAVQVQFVQYCLPKSTSTVCLQHNTVKHGEARTPRTGGFTKGRGCTDATAALKVTIQQLRNANRDSYVLFLDLVKAFDSVNREMLWKILAKYGLPDSLIVVIRKMYSNIKITISSRTAKTTFLSTSGVKQGDNVAALLFLFVMMAASELIEARWNKLNLAKPELYISDKKYINHRDTASSRIKHVSYYESLYADAVGLIFQTHLPDF